MAAQIGLATCFAFVLLAILFCLPAILSRVRLIAGRSRELHSTLSFPVGTQPAGLDTFITFCRRRRSGKRNLAVIGKLILRDSSILYPPERETHYFLMLGWAALAGADEKCRTVEFCCSRRMRCEFSHLAKDRRGCRQGLTQPDNLMFRTRGRSVSQSVSSLTSHQQWSNILRANGG